MTAFEIIKGLTKEFKNKSDYKIEGNTISFKNVKNGRSTFVFNENGEITKYIE